MRKLLYIIVVGLLITAFNYTHAFLFTHGESMLPVMKDAFCIVNKVKKPKLNDIIAYEAGDEIVVHRVIAITQSGHMFCAGDNNDYVDPYTITNDNLIGVVTVYINGIKTN